MNLKKIIIFITVIAVLVLLFIFLKGLFSKSSSPANITSPQTETVKRDVSEKDKPTIVSTKPDSLDNTIISATEVIEITFNRPLENVGEFKSKIEPEVDYKVELSGDRKTARIIPAKPYNLGATYTLSIGSETKFDGVGRWGEEKRFQFRTIKYTGV